jgi:hypothetical protein
MTTNSLKSLNKVLKGIRAVPMPGIVEYSFRKCNEYFVNRWNITKVSKEKWGHAGGKHLDLAEAIAPNDRDNFHNEMFDAVPVTTPTLAL